MVTFFVIVGVVELGIFLGIVFAWLNELARGAEVLMDTDDDAA